MRVDQMAFTGKVRAELPKMETTFHGNIGAGVAGWSIKLFDDTGHVLTVYGATLCTARARAAPFISA